MPESPKKMTDENDKQAEPLCRFGPGGDFITCWDSEPIGPEYSSNRIAKLMISIIEALSVSIGIRQKIAFMNINHFGQEESDSTNEVDVFDKEATHNAVKSTESAERNDSATASAAEDDSRLPAEPMLFPDAGGDGRRIKYQPKHRIRTYRRTAKKRPAFRFCEQGSLFEGQFRSARTA